MASRQLNFNYRNDMDKDEIEESSPGYMSMLSLLNLDYRATSVRDLSFNSSLFTSRARSKLFN